MMIGKSIIIAIYYFLLLKIKRKRDIEFIFNTSFLPNEQVA